MVAYRGHAGRSLLFDPDIRLLLAAAEAGSPAGVFEKRGDFPAPRYLDYPLSDAAGVFTKAGHLFCSARFPSGWLTCSAV